MKEKFNHVNARLHRVWFNRVQLKTYRILLYRHYYHLLR